MPGRQKKTVRSGKPARSTPAGNPLKAQFSRPPSRFRILKIIHGWPDAAEAQDSLIASLRNQAFGGVVCNVSFTDYLRSEPRWQSFTRAVGAARAAGFSMWLYDEKGYPSGTAGDIVLRGKPDWQARGLLTADAVATSAGVRLKCPPGRLVLASAYPYTGRTIDIAAGVDLRERIVDGAIEWAAPSGRWHLLLMTEAPLFEGTHMTVSFGEHQPYINMLMKEPTRRFIDSTHGSYLEHLGPDISKYFAATFTDEPSLMSLFMRGMPYKPLPWSPQFAWEFHKRRGYEIDARLAALVADAGAVGSRTRCDFWLTVAELTEEGFFEPIQAWGREHGVPSGGHLLAEESLLAHTPLYGDFFRCARRLDAPSIDCLTSIPGEVPWHVARLISSVAELEERKVTMCEASDHVQVYRAQDDKRPVHEVSEEEIRGSLNRLILGGINTITSYYSFRGLTTAAICRLNEWVGRCCVMTEGGHQVTDIAVVYPVESIWARFQPSKLWTQTPGQAAPIEAAFRSVTDGLYASGRDFTYIDTKALMKAAPRGGVLTHGKLRWRVVVLPGIDTLPIAAWENLQRFVRGGGMLVAVGALPANTPTEFPSARVQAIAGELFGVGGSPVVRTHPGGGACILLPPGSEGLISNAVDALVAPDVALADRTAPIRVTHRRIGSTDVYFVINDSNSRWRGPVWFSAEGPAELWNPATGDITLLRDPDEEKPGSGAIEIELNRYSAVVVRFRRAIPPARKTIQGGPLPGLNLAPLPRSEPATGQGEFVEGTVEPGAVGGQTGWIARARLKKGGVDTYQFLVFRYEQKLDLRKCSGLMVCTGVPDTGQEGPALLIIVRDASGREAVIETGRALSDAGVQTTYLSLDRLQPAPWSTGPKDPLDRSAIVAISVGWGGHLGFEGQELSFGVAPISVASAPVRRRR